MKFNLKFRIVVLVLLMIMISSINLVSNNVYAEDKHNYELYGEDPSICIHDYRIDVKTYYEDKDSSRHTVFNVITNTCKKCNDSYDIEDSYYAPHSIGMSHWHSVKLHYVQYACGYCSYIESTTSYTCPGNPCIVIYKMTAVE